MRRFSRQVFLVALCFVLLAFPVSASSLTFDHSWQENGDTYLGTFHVKDLADVDLDMWKSYMTSERLFAEQDEDHRIYFLNVPAGVSGKIAKNASGSSYRYNIVFSPAFDVKSMVFQYSASTGMYEFMGYYKLDNFTGFGLDAVIVHRGFSLSADVPSSELYIEHPGALYLVDDLGNEMEGEGAGSSPDKDESFWDKLKGFFVPEDGFFSDWFDEIEGAASKKLKPISETFDYLKGAFETLKAGAPDKGFYLDIPPNHFYDGFPGIRVDLLSSVGSLTGAVRTMLTMVCVIFTAICCYRKLVDIFER